MIEICEIPLRALDGSVRAVALVDREDFERFGMFRWSLHVRGYVVRTIHPKAGEGKKETRRLHREILGLRSGDPRYGDHINRNPLDNRKANLRIVPPSVSRQNTGAQKNSTSPYRGVSRTPWGRWAAQVGFNGRKHRCGFYDTQEEAALAALEFRRKHLPYSVD